MNLSLKTYGDEVATEKELLIRILEDTSEIKDRHLVALDKVADAIREQSNATSAQSNSIRILCSHLEVLKNSVPLKVVFYIFALVFALVFGVSILKRFGLLSV